MLVAMKLQHLLTESINGCWHETGRPPNIVRASRFIRKAIEEEITRDYGPFSFDSAACCVGIEFMFMGVVVLCDLNTETPTAIAFVDKPY